MPIYVDRKTQRLYIEFQYRGTRVKERLPAGTSKKDAEKIEVKIKNDLMFQSHGIETGKVITFPMTFWCIYPHTLPRESRHQST